MENKVAVNAVGALAQKSRLAVLRVLVQNGLDGLTVGVIGDMLEMPAATLSFHLRTLAQVEVDGRVVGTAGVEAFGTDALLRSLTVAEASRGAGLASQLIDWCEMQARRRRVQTAYLLTTTAADYFKKRGYSDVPREAVPAAVAGHAQFRNLCPASAKCLGKRL